MESETWYTSTLDCGGISYLARTYQNDGLDQTVTVDRVNFSRFNTDAHVREIVSIHWSEAFKWADYDPCGGLSIDSVTLTNGSKTFASGLYFGAGHKDQHSREKSGLCAVVVGCYGRPWLKREKRPVRDEHGFPIHQQAAV